LPAAFFRIPTARRLRGQRSSSRKRHAGGCGFSEKYQGTGLIASVRKTAPASKAGAGRNV